MVEYLIENYQKDVGMICLNSSKEGINMYLLLDLKRKIIIWFIRMDSVE